jgi:Cof subfamily protein (haloacid dehalogenase superfamily)
MEISLIAYDLDGTALDSQKRLPEKNLAALEAAGRKGLLLVPATGRLRKAIPEVLLRLPGARYAITENGAGIWDEVQQRYPMHVGFSAEQTEALFRYAEERGWPCDVYQAGYGFIAEKTYRALPDLLQNPVLEAMMLPYRDPVPDLRQAVSECGEPVQKVQFYFSGAAARNAVFAAVRKDFPDCEVTRSSPVNIEFSPRGVNKGTALAWLCSRLRRSTAEAAAFGDDVNDLAMLRTAGVGIAMGNADPEVKKAARTVTLTNDEAGLGVALEVLLR